MQADKGASPHGFNLENIKSGFSELHLSKMELPASTPTSDKASFENALYVGIIIISIIYGFYLGLAFVIARIVIYNPSISQFRKRIYLGFGGALFLLNTFAYVCMPLIGQLIWIVYRDLEEFASGPYSCYMKITRGPGIAWHMVFADLAQVLSMFLSDALLIYRCHIIFGSRLKVIAFPVTCLIGYALASILSYVPPLTNTNKPYINLQLTKITLMFLVNPMVTIMITWRIFAAARNSRGDTRIEKLYTNVSAALIESAAPWTIIGISVLIASWIGNIFWWVGIYMIWVATGMLLPQLLIFRLFMSIESDKRTSLESEKVSTMIFASTPPVTDLDSDELEPSVQARPIMSV